MIFVFLIFVFVESAGLFRKQNSSLFYALTIHYVIKLIPK